jgi:hypothetical protein
MNDWFRSNTIDPSRLLYHTIVPGFLLGFAARYDEAARILGNHANIDIYVPNKWHQGYFFPCCVAYAVGLLLANLAVVLMETGQPALLYLVPCILGTFCIMARKEIKEMWVEGPAIRMADRLIIKCERHWKRQKMKKQVEKCDRERKLQTYQEGATSGSIDMTGEVQTSPTINNTGVPSGQDRATRGAAGASAPGHRPPRRPPAGGRVGQNPGRDNNPSRGVRKRPPNVENPRRGQPASSRLCGTADAQRAPPPSGGGPTQGPAATRTPAPKQNKAAKEEPPPQEARASLGNCGDTPYNVDDICLGNENHSGTKDFRRALRKSVKKHVDEDYGPEIYKSIRKQFKGRRFFEEASPGTWVELSKSEMIREMSKAFNAEKMKITSK